MQLLAERLLHVYKPDEHFNLDFEIRWAKQIRKIIKAIVYMEKGKVTYPKFGESPALQQLSQHLKSVFVSFDTLCNLIGRRHYEHHHRKQLHVRRPERVHKRLPTQKV